ncbi:hypothetical protein CROQUDRAFT_85443 [Cronartium quercuum f. sp. fusiforme G11]|uniref:ABM domain-containing protein n=1 Tax=Cronartium quercuum f. sp. fusiforme G11 TaxID=708437 RepID=A0A9P6NS15_9BASI|nr:hypothetical protein CROQUDRAFT_85443 [Cronartium quercuum f. sp. fusiforme G11]
MSLPEVPSSLHQCKFIVLATVVAADGKADEVQTHLLKIRDRANSSEEPKTLSYRVTKSVENPETFIIFEEYVGHSGYDAHLKSDSFKALSKEADSILKSLDVKYHLEL